MSEERDETTQAEDDELAQMVEALTEAGLAEHYKRADGTSAVRLTERGEELLRQLPEELQQE